MRVEVRFETDAAAEVQRIAAAGAPGGYQDLRENPLGLDEIEPARKHPPLRSFLAALNSEDSLFATLRCRAEAATAGAESEFSTEVALAFVLPAFNADPERYENLTARLQELLTAGAADTLTATLRVRRCLLPPAGTRGLCLLIRLAAHGATPQQAELRWSLGLVRVQQALLFLSRTFRHQMAQGS